MKETRKIMDATQNRKSTGKAIVLVVVVAVVTATVTTLVQVLLWGASQPAITGGVVGAVTAAAAFSTIRNKKEVGQSASEK
jgi:uncharacterized transporter YbjL